MTNVTHELDENGEIACKRPTGDSAPAPGASTCGHQNCRELRERVRANRCPSWLVAWPTPLTPARAYAAKAYSVLRHSTCPGGTGHEGNGASAEYCNACIAEAIALAFEAGQKWGGY
jgi:hypothetical protein